MDVEKLIRRLRNDADAYRNGKTLGRAFADQEDVLDNAATALSTLQVENEKLRAELEQVKQCVDGKPAADVAPVRHGKWEPGNPICPVCGENKFKDLDADVWADWQPKFCPNCGALMDKEDEHEAD